MDYEDHPMCKTALLANAGIAHLLEHMAFKGSQRIGARDYKKEAGLLEAADDGAIRIHA